MSREELARGAKLSASYIYRIEKGQVSTPSHKTLSALAGALQVSIDKLTGTEGLETSKKIVMDEIAALRLLLQSTGQTAEKAQAAIRIYERLNPHWRKVASDMLLAYLQGFGNTDNQEEGKEPE